MELRFSVMARDRKFSRVMRRIRPKLQPLLDAFGHAELHHLIHESLLVGITDDRETGFLEEIENSDGYFQVIAGCSADGSDADLAEAVFGILLQAVRLCPFAAPDHKMLEALFAQTRSACLDVGN